jgi:phytoene dehydrogenase-like protein
VPADDHAPPRATGTTDTFDAIVVGAGHNGLVTAAYLARAGMRTALVEARAAVGGTAASEGFAGATVNICNCDHITFRTTPVIDELRLGEFGLHYLDVDPAQVCLAWSGGPPWAQFHDVERTLDSLRATYPDEVDGYRRYVKAALPAVDMVLAAASEPPRPAALTAMAVRRRLVGVPTLLRWSRRSAAGVLRDFFRSDALLGPAAVTGPMVWGVTPELPGTGLGALSYALRHRGKVGRPVGGSGMVPTALRAAFEHYGGTVLLSTKVEAILCEAGGVRGVRTATGGELQAPVVVSACDPYRTFVEWLINPPPSAEALRARWRAAPRLEGYESKIDAVVTALPRLRDGSEELWGGGGEPFAATLTVAPSLADIHRGAEMMGRGEILDRPGLLVNVPTVLDPSMAPPGRHVFSLEALYTPYRFTRGWDDRTEPARWLDRFAELVEPGFLESITDWRAMTPDVYERDFHLPAGHAASFAAGPLAAFRNPMPESTRYETVVPGLYLTGAATFPGAGIWGASGRNCATVVLARPSPFTRRARPSRAWRPAPCRSTGS